MTSVWDGAAVDSSGAAAEGTGISVEPRGVSSGADTGVGLCVRPSGSRAMTGLSPGLRMRTTRALGATADDGGAAPGAGGSVLAALDSEFGTRPSSVSSCGAEDVTFAGEGAS